MRCRQIVIAYKQGLYRCTSEIHIFFSVILFYRFEFGFYDEEKVEISPLDRKDWEQRQKSLRYTCKFKRRIFSNVPAALWKQKYHDATLLNAEINFNLANHLMRAIIQSRALNYQCCYTICIFIFKPHNSTDTFP